MADESRPWTPPLTPKGQYLFDLFKRFILLDGPRFTGKTLSILHKVCRHLWEVQYAKVGIITTTLRQGKTGAWDDLIGWVVQTWIDAGMGFKYKQAPKMEADTKMSWFSVINFYGGESVCQLHSLKHEQDIETQFKDPRFSMIYLVEGDKFKERKTFTALRTQLRAIGVPEHQYQFVIDCNPPEEGEDHFLHDVFLKKLGNNSREQGPDPKFYDNFERIQMLLEDNTFLSPERLEEQLNAYRYDPDLYARWTEGKWVKYGAKGVFMDIYFPNIHVRGDASNPEEPEIIIPTEHCFELFTGWDIGDVNHAAGIAFRRDAGDHAAFDLIDEHVVIDRPISIQNFTIGFMEKMDRWEALLKERYGIENLLWRHWSDITAFGRYRAAADAYDEQVVRQASGGRIKLSPVLGGRETVEDGISLLKKLLFHRRLFVSAHLHYTKAMFAKLRRSAKQAEYIDPHQEEKHICDVWRYALSSEAPMDLERRTRPVTQRMVSVPA